MEQLVRVLSRYPVFFDTAGTWVMLFLIASLVLLDWFWLSRQKSYLLRWVIRIALLMLNLVLGATLFMVNLPLKPMISELAKVQRLIGKPVPAFSFVSVRDSVRYQLPDFGNEVIIINYWATYCGPCVEELPTLKAVEAAFEGKVTVVAITDEDGQRVKDFLERVEAPRYVGLSTASFLKMNGFLPVTVICKNGRISTYVFGRQDFDFFKAQVAG